MPYCCQNIWLDTIILFTKGTELIIFGQLEIPMKLSINLNLKTLRVLNCLCMNFSTLYTSLPHHLLKDKLVNLINRTFIRKNTHYLACNEECSFFTPDVYKNYNLWSGKKVRNALVYLLNIIFIRFENKLYRQNTGIPMGIKISSCCCRFVSFFSYENYLWSLSHGKIRLTLFRLSIPLQDTLMIY